MNGISELLQRYGTSLKETRALIPQLTEAVKQKRVVKPPAFPKTPQLFDPAEAQEMGVQLDPGWMLKVTPPVDGQEPVISLISPENWEILEDQSVISPEGKLFTREEFEAQFIAPEVPVGIPGVVPEVPLEVEQVFGRVFPERDVIDVLAYAEAQPEAFYSDILAVGRTPETEDLIKTMFPEITPEQTEEFFGAMPTVEPESKIKDIWDAFYVGAAQMWQQTKEYFLSTLPNMFFGTTGEFVKSMGFTPEIREADERMLKQWRSTFRKQYVKSKNEYQEWVDAHPELAPRSEWERGTLETIKSNPAILKDPAYWGYVAADSAAFMLAFLGTTLAVSAATGNPFLGMAAGVAVTTPAQSQDLYEDLLANGATEDQAAVLSVPIGVAISSVEAVGAFPFLKAVSPQFSKILRKNIQKEVVKQTLAHLAGRGLWTFTQVEVAETMEEIVQQAIQNATVKTINENRGILEGLDETTVRTLMATAPFAVFGGGMSMRRVPDVEANKLSPEQKREQGWQKDEETGDWLKPEGIPSQEELAKDTKEVLMVLPDSEKILSGVMLDTWHRKFLRGIAVLPPAKKVIEWGLGTRILVKRWSDAIEDIVGRGRFLHSEIARRGEGAQAHIYWRLFNIEPNPVKLFGFNEQAVAPARKLGRLTEDADGTIEDVFTHPEKYDLDDKQLQYVTQVHQMNTLIRNMLIEEGVAEEIVGNDWWMHRVVYGKYDPNGELVKVRGRPGVKRGKIGAKVSFEMHRKAPTMAEGIAWNILYGRDPSESVSTYAAEAFKKIADARFEKYMAEQLEPLARAGVLPKEELLRKYPEVVERAIISAEELADSKSFMDKIRRAIRGEKLPGQTLAAIERRFPELGVRFRALVEEPATADKELRAALKQTERIIKNLAARLEKVKTVDVAAVKAEATAKARAEAMAEARGVIPDDVKLAEAFRIMDYEDRLAFRSAMESQVAKIERMLVEQDFELKGVLEFLEADPVASFQVTRPYKTRAGKTVQRVMKLTDVLVQGQFPESVTLKQAAFLMMKPEEDVVHVEKGRVKREYVIDELADHFGMLEQELIDHIEFIYQQQTHANDLKFLVSDADSRQGDIRRMLKVLDGVDTKPEFVPVAEQAPLPIPKPVLREEMTLDEFKGTLGKVVVETKEEIKNTRKWLTGQRAQKQVKMPIDERLFAEELARVEALEDRLPTFLEMQAKPEEYFDRVQSEFPNLYNLLLDRGRELKTIPRKPPVIEAKPEVPVAEIGMPEAGLQQDIFGFQHPVFPKGKGEITQIGMDDYGKLVDAYKEAGVPPPDVGVIPVVEGVKGLEPEVGRVMSQEEENTLSTIEHIKADIELTKRRIERLKKTAKERPGWEYYDKYAEAKVGIDVRIEEQEAVLDELQNSELPKLEKQLEKARAKAVKAAPPTHKGEAPVSSAKYAKISYEIPEVKPQTERKEALRALLDEVKALSEAKRLPFWQAKAERAYRMEQIRQPGIEEGYIMQPFAGGRKFDQEFIDAFNKFFGHDAGLPFLRVTADTAGIMRILKAALDFSQPAIQGTPSWGLAHSYLITNPAKGARLMGAWYYTFFLQIGAFFNPGIAAKFMEKHKDSISRRIAAGGSARAVFMFQEMQATVGKGTLARWGEKGLAMIPLDPYHRAETSFFMGGEAVRDIYWEIFEADAIAKGEEAELAHFLDILTGIADPRAMGVPLTVRQLEQSFIWFSSAYTRSYLALVGDIFRGGMTGAQAKRAIGGFIVAGAAYFTGIQYAISTLMGKDDDEAWEDVRGGFGIEQDPITKEWQWRPSARFASLKIGDTYFGIGGGLYGLARLFGNVIATVNEVGERERIDLIRIMKHGSLNKRDNPWLSWWFSRSSALFGAVYDLATQRDFLGYPIETPQEYARYIISLLEPIWVEQSLNPLIPGMAGNREKPEGALETVMWIAGEVFGLRVNPEYSWQRFYNKANEYIGLMSEDKLEDWQKEAWREGKLKWANLTPPQQTDLLFNHPELYKVYEEAQADSELRAGPHWKEWEGRQKEEKAIYYERGGELWERLVSGELDTRELREMWSEAGQNYGVGLDAIAKEPNYEWVYDFFDRKRDKGVKYIEEAFLALAEYQNIMFAEYVDEKGDIDWDAKDRAIDGFVEKYGVDMYETIRQMYAQKKELEGLPDGLVRLADDKDKLGRGYWRLPYKPIKDMDRDDDVDGNIPAEYYADWKAYQALETDEQREEFLQRHPEIAKDWRAEYRQNNPEADARLALWGYGGKLQSRVAFDLVVQWARELGIPLEQIGLGLPPYSLIEDYFDLNKIVAETSGSSAEAKLFKLEHPEYLAWGLEQGIWKDDLSGENTEALRITVKWRDMDKQYEVIEGTEDRQAFLQANPEYANDRRRRDAYGYGFPDNLLDSYAEYYKIPKAGYEDEWYLMEHPEFYNKAKELLGWQEKDFSKVPSREVFKLIQQYDKQPKGKARLIFRHEHPELEDWFVKVKGYKPVGDRWKDGKTGGVENGEPEAPKTPEDEREEAERIREWLEGLK